MFLRVTSATFALQIPDLFILNNWVVEFQVFSYKFIDVFLRKGILYLRYKFSKFTQN